MIGIQGCFSPFQLHPYFRQLLFQKVQALLGFSGFTLYVLAYIQPADLIQRTHGLLRVHALQTQRQNPRVAAFFTHPYLALIAQYGAQLVALGNRKIGAWPRDQLGYLNTKALFRQGRANRTGHQRATVCIEEGIGAILARAHNQSSTYVGSRNFKLKNID